LSKNKPKTKAGSTLELPLEPPVDPKELLIGLAATRMHLEATIANAGKVAAKDVPMTLSSVRQGVDSFSDLAKTLRKETVVTAPSVRDTLQDARVNLKQVGEAGLSARVTSEEIRNLIETLKKLLN
jgi:hypothetical protein